MNLSPLPPARIVGFAGKSLLKSALFLTLALGALCGPMSEAAVIPVKIVDYEFDPVVVTIAPGDTVLWTSYGMDHTVASDTGLFDSSISQPEPSIPVFGTFSVTFDTAGEFPYYCGVHGGPGGIGMSGRVRVVVPGLNHAPAKPVNSAPTAGGTGISKAPLLTASPFTDEDAGDTHVSSQWLVRKVSDSSVVLDSGEDSADKLSLRVLNLSNSSEYEWQVRYKDSANAWSDYSDPTKFTTIAPLPAGTPGLKGSYGSFVPKTGLTKIIGTRVDPAINFAWGAGASFSKVPANNFYVKWEGSLLPPTSEIYRFRVVADGGVKLRVNGVLLIDDWKVATFAVYRSAVATLDAGVPVPIVLEYYDTTGNASVQLRWVSPTHPLEVIPSTNLSSPLP